MPPSSSLLAFPLLLLTFSIVHSLDKGCDLSEMGKGRKNFPKSISIASVLKATGIPENTCGMAMREWPQRKGTFVVYAEDSAGFSVFLLHKNGGSFLVDAKYTDAFPGKSRFSSFDFARYQISQRSIAFGIRYLERGMNYSAERVCSKLSLLEPFEGGLREVLYVAMLYDEYFAEDRDEVARRTDEGIRESAVLTIGKADSSGYNRIIQKVGGKEATFSWKGDGYSSDLVLIDRCYNE